MAGRKTSGRSRRSESRADAGAEGVWERLSGRARHLICIAALLVVALGFYAPAIFGDRSFAPTDTVQWRAMAEVILETGEETGEYPLWTPAAFGGIPAYMIYYPTVVPQLDTLVKQLRPLMWPAAHFFVLLLGTYFFVYFLTRRRLAALLAACAFGLTTYLPVILVAGHNTKFLALAYAPWMALAFAHAMKHPRLLAALLFAGALALNLRANHVQITYYLTFFLGIWWLVEAVGALRNGARHGERKKFLASTGWLALGSVLGLLMVAQPYLPIAEFREYTTRGAAGAEAAAGLGWEYAMAWSQGFGELLTLIVPGAYGGGGATYWGPKIFTAGPHYVGGIVVLLALVALWKVRRNVVLASGIAAAVMVAFSLGEFFPLLNRPFFDYFPLFNAFRVPETWLSMVAFVLAALAGIGLAYLASPADRQEDEEKKTRAVYVALGVVGGFVLVLFLMRGAFFDFQKPGELEQVMQQAAQQYGMEPSDPRIEQAARQYLAGVQAEREEMFTSDALRTLLFLALAGALLLAQRKRKIPAWAMQAGLALLVVVDLWGVGRDYFNEDVLVPSPTGDRAELLEGQIPVTGADRFLLERREAAGGMGHFRVVSFVSGNPMTYAIPSYFHESLGGYSAADLRLYQDFVDHVFTDASGLPNEQALDLLNTRYVIAGGRLPGTEVVYQDEQTGLAVLENPDALPRAFFVGETEVVPSRDEMLARLGREDFDPRRTALLAAPLDAELAPVDSASSASVELVEYDPEEITWRVATDAQRLLVASEIYYPAGWRATLDGEPVPIHRVDYLLRGVVVPPGEHTLTMRFEPGRHELGVWISAVSTVLVYGGVFLLLGLAWRRRRTP